MSGSSDSVRDFMKWALGGSSDSKIKKDEYGNGYFERKPSHYYGDIRTSSFSSSSRCYDSSSSYGSGSGSGSGSSSGSGPRSRYYSGKDYTLSSLGSGSGSGSRSYSGRTDYSSYYSADTVKPEDSVSQAAARKAAAPKKYC